MVSYRNHLSQSLGKVSKTQVHNSVNLKSILKSVPESPLLIRAPSDCIGRIEAEETLQSSCPAHSTLERRIIRCHPF